MINTFNRNFVTKSTLALLYYSKQDVDSIMTTTNSNISSIQSSIGHVQDVNGAINSAITVALYNNNQNYIPNTDKGSANGVCPLDSSSKISSTYLPYGMLSYGGMYDGTQNLQNGTGVSGQVFISSVTTTHDFGAGSVAIANRDWIVYNGSVWQTNSSTDAVASVFGRSGIITAQSSDYSSFYYTKAQIDTSLANYTTTSALTTLLSSKVDSSTLTSYYTKTQVDSTFTNYTLTTDLTTALATKANTSALASYYTSTQTDTLLSAKANTSALASYYTKTQIDTSFTSYTTTTNLTNLLAGKVDSSTLNSYYTKTQVDTTFTSYTLTSDLTIALASKANTSALSSYYTSTQTDTLLSAKANTSALASYYTSTQTDTLLSSKANSSTLSNYLLNNTSQTLTDNSTASIGLIIKNTNTTDGNSARLTFLNNNSSANNYRAIIESKSDGTNQIIRFMNSSIQSSTLIDFLNCYNNNSVLTTNLTGDTINLTGAVVFSSTATLAHAPTTGNDVTNKTYVDAYSYSRTYIDNYSYSKSASDAKYALVSTLTSSYYTQNDCISIFATQSTLNNNFSTTAQMNTALGSYVLSSLINASNGICGLDSSGKVPVSKLPYSDLLQYVGTWNGTTPNLTNGTGSIGQVYISGVNTTHDFGAGNVTIHINDWILYNGTIWEVNQGNDQVSSAFGRTGAIVATAGDYDSFYYTKSASDAKYALSSALSSYLLNNISQTLTDNSTGNIGLTILNSNTTTGSSARLTLINNNNGSSAYKCSIESLTDGTSEQMKFKLSSITTSTLTEFLSANNNAGTVTLGITGNTSITGTLTTSSWILSSGGIQSNNGLSVTAGTSTIQALSATTGTFSGLVSLTTGSISTAPSVANSIVNKNYLDTNYYTQNDCISIFATQTTLTTNYSTTTQMNTAISSAITSSTISLAGNNTWTGTNAYQALASYDATTNGNIPAIGSTNYNLITASYLNTQLGNYAKLATTNTFADALTVQATSGSHWEGLSIKNNTTTANIYTRFGLYANNGNSKYQVQMLQDGSANATVKMALSTYNSSGSLTEFLWCNNNSSTGVQLNFTASGMILYAPVTITQALSCQSSISSQQILINSTVQAPLQVLGSDATAMEVTVKNVNTTANALSRLSILTNNSANGKTTIDVKNDGSAISTTSFKCCAYNNQTLTEYFKITNTANTIAMTLTGALTIASALTCSSTLATSGLLSSSAGLTVSTGTTSLQALTATTIGGTTGTFSGLISGSAGLTISTGTTSLQALTATTIGGTTGTFSGLISGSAGLTISSGTTSLQATTVTALTLTSGTISTAPTNSTDIVNKTYVDSVIAIYSPKFLVASNSGVFTVTQSSTTTNSTLYSISTSNTATAYNYGNTVVFMRPFQAPQCQYNYVGMTPLRYFCVKITGTSTTTDLMAYVRLGVTSMGYMQGQQETLSANNPSAPSSANIAKYLYGGVDSYANFLLTMGWNSSVPQWTIPDPTLYNINAENLSTTPAYSYTSGSTYTRYLFFGFFYHNNGSGTISPFTCMWVQDGIASNSNCLGGCHEIWDGTAETSTYRTTVNARPHDVYPTLNFYMPSSGTPFTGFEVCRNIASNCIKLPTAGACNMFGGTSWFSNVFDQ